MRVNNKDRIRGLSISVLVSGGVRRQATLLTFLTDFRALHFYSAFDRRRLLGGGYSEQLLIIGDLFVGVRLTRALQQHKNSSLVMTLHSIPSAIPK